MYFTPILLDLNALQYEDSGPWLTMNCCLAVLTSSMRTLEFRRVRQDAILVLLRYLADFCSVPSQRFVTRIEYVNQYEVAMYHAK